MNKGKHPGKKIRQIAAALAMVMLVCSIQMPSVFGAFDVSITDASKSEQWEKNRAQTYAEVREMHPEYFYKGMLWIGTWLIDSTVLNDSMYNLASDSVEKSGQSIFYYYSELADEANGEWRDAGNATGLKDITFEGEKVPESELNPLWIAYVVLADGKVRSVEDVATGRGGATPINPFNVVNPYDILNLPELDSVKTQFGQYEQQYSEWINNKQSSPTFDWIQEQHRCITCAALRLDNWTPLTSRFPFLRQNMQNGETQQCDQDLDTLYSYYSYYCDLGQREYADEIMRLMEATDARRRAISYRWLSIEGTDRPTSQQAMKDAENASKYQDFVQKYGTWEEVQRNPLRFYPGWGEFVQYGLFYVPPGPFGYAVVFQRAFGAHPSQFTPPQASSLNQIPRLATAQNLIYSGITYNQRRRGRDDEGEFNDNYYDVVFTPDSAYVDALSDALEKCQESYAKYEQLSITDNAEQILQHKIYETAERTITYARNRNMESLESNLHELVLLGHLEQNAIVEREAERSRLRDLMNEANNRLTDRISAGASADYQTAQSEGKEDKVLNAILEEQKGLATNVVGQLQFFTSEMTDRLDKDAAVSFIDAQINWTESRRSVIRQDGFSAKAGEVLDAHIAWLRQLRNKILGDETGDEDLDKLKAEKDELQTEMLDALDENNLQGAREIEDKIGELQDQIDEILASAEETLNSGNAVDAAAAASMLQNTPSASAEEIANKAKEDIQDGNLSTVDRYLEALGGLGASKQIKEIQDLLDRNGAANRYKNLAKDALAESEKGGLIGTGGSGTGSGGQAGGGTGGSAGSGTGDQSGQGTESGDQTGQGTGGTGTGQGSQGTGTGGSGQGTGTGQGTGSGEPALGDQFNTGGARAVSAADKSALDMLNGAIRSTFGSDPSDLSDEDKATACAGLARFAKDLSGGTGGRRGTSGSGAGSSSGTSSTGGATEGASGGEQGGAGGSDTGATTGAGGTGGGDTGGTTGAGDTGGADGTGADGAGGAGSADGTGGTEGTEGAGGTDGANGGAGAGGAGGTGGDGSGRGGAAGGSDSASPDGKLGNASMALARQLLDEMLASGSTFIYRQYMGDPSHPYVSLWTLDLCRRESGFRIATQAGEEAMVETNGSKSYVFRVGEREAISGTGKKTVLRFKPVSQNDRYTSSRTGKESTYRYAYISIEDAEALLNNSCVYVPETEYAVLAPPRMDGKLRSFLKALQEGQAEFRR